MTDVSDTPIEASQIPAQTSEIPVDTSRPPADRPQTGTEPPQTPAVETEIPTDPRERPRLGTAERVVLVGAVVAALVVSVLALVATSHRTTIVIGAHAPALGVSVDLYRQIGQLQSRVESQGTEQTIILTFIALLLTLSAAGFVLTDRRAREVHSLAIRGESAAQARIAEAHQLAMKGESATQTRVAEVHTSFLQGSLQTLDLVNQTLELERIASQRAASAVEEKARDQLKRLDQDAKYLLSRVPTDDDHKLVSDQALRGDLTSLARRIASFDSALLPVEVPLTPHCRFVRGMQLHLEQHFDDAFDEWEEVAFGEGVDPDLRSLTWYWIGRERGNLGQYADAERALEQALKDAPEARRYEVERLKLELEFFDAGSYQPATLLDQMQQLIDKTRAVGTDTATRALPHMKAILGNLHYELALECRANGKVAEARAHFEQCKTIFEGIQDEKWAIFGLAEALWWLGERKKAESLFANEARALAQDDYVHRIEYRAKVLARSAELICCARATELRPQADHIFQDVLDALGRVDGRMTIYSEVQRRNVTKTEFVADMNVILHQAKKVPKSV